MRIATRLAIVLFALGLAPKLGAQQTAVVINLTEQTAYLLEDGQVAFISPIASGKEGRDTPTGSFRIISKDLNHQSRSYGLVGDSHGRIINPNATPGDMAAEFFTRVRIGTPVKVIGSARNVTRVRRAIPIVQPGNSRFATEIFKSPGRD
jgi:L,D-transpeptidase-like protein